MERFTEALVRCVALNVLLAHDFIGKAVQLQGVREHVARELPRILGLLDPTYRAHFALPDPAEAVRDFVAKRHSRSWDAMTEILDDLGHRDLVFASLKYTRKPPKTEEDGIDELTEIVARVLGAPAPDPDSVALAYAAAHYELIRRP